MNLLPLLSLLWTFPLGLATPVDPAAVSPRALVLLVGVGTYKYPLVPSLSAPPKDVAKMREFLISRYGIRPENIRILINEQATKQNIWKELRRLARLAGPDVPIIFYFSGHGSRVNDDPNGDEDDKLDETILPYDMNGQPESHLIDDEIGKWLDTVRSRKITLIFDSCNSGTAYKGMPIKLQHEVARVMQAKYWPNPFLKPVSNVAPIAKSSSTKTFRHIRGFRRIVIPFRQSYTHRTRRVARRSRPIRRRQRPLHRNEQPEHRIQEEAASASTSTATPPRRQPPARRPSPASPRLFTFLAASRDYEMAFDVGGTTNSIFTHHLIQAAMTSSPNASVQQLVSRVQASVSRFLPQTPNAEGVTDQPLFFLPPLPPRPVPPVVSTHIDSLPHTVRGCNKRGFCATLQLLNKKGVPTNDFPNGTEIMFAVKLNRPGYIALVNIFGQQQKSILFPDDYFKRLRELKPPIIRPFSYHIHGSRWNLLPPGEQESPAFFKIAANPGEQEAVELIASDQKLDFRKLIRLPVSAVPKRILTLARIQQRPQIVSVRLNINVR